MTADQNVVIRRDAASGTVRAHGCDQEVHSILQRAGFVPVIRLHETHHRAPANLTADEETHLATEAVARLRGAGYDVDCDAAFDTGRRPVRPLPIGALVAQLAARIREAATTGAAADVLVELTDPHDGILAGVEDVLRATANFHEGLDGAADPHIAQRLHRLADESLHVIRTDLAYTRDALADRHTPHPRRIAEPRQIPATERERSAACARPQPPRGGPAAPPPPDAAGPRR